MKSFRSETLRRLVLVATAAVGVQAPVAHAQEADAISRATPVMPEPNAPISASRTKAHKLFKALTGVPIPIDDPRLKEMEALINQGNDREAVKVATRDPLFYNIRVRDLARKMSTRDESVRAQLNDFVATFVGVVRDSDTTSAKELLTGNFTYIADPNLTIVAGAQKVRSNVLNDMIASNNHYADVEANGFSLKTVLVRADGQQTTLTSNNAAAVPHPDPAGLLSTRAWAAAHADAGTNRRLVEYTFRQFMCVPITDWADASSPDDRVGRDVDRQPSGSANKYLTTCKACHGNMDGLRGAFAKIDFTGNRPVYNSTGVVGKMNRNANEFPGGFPTTEDSFINYATVGKNADRFGWRSGLTGRGMGELGKMIANSQGFSRCMVRKVFSAVCKRDPNSSEESMVRKMADDFEVTNYHMRRLFESVSLRPECLGSI